MPVSSASPPAQLQAAASISEARTDTNERLRHLSSGCMLVGSGNDGRLSEVTQGAGVEIAK